MKTAQVKEVKKLKLNVTNINSFLKKSNKDYVAIKKNNKRLVSDQVKRKKTKEKEKTIEKKSVGGSALSNVKDVAKSSAGIFDKILSFGGILLSGILLNALPSIKKKVDKFAKDNKEIIGNVTKSLIVVKDFTVNLFDAFTGPYSQENSLDWLGKFNDSGKLESGVLKKVEQAFDGVGKMINDIDKALGGEGKIGNAIITGERVLATQGGKTGEYNKTTKEFTPRAFTEEENRRYQSGDFRPEGSTNNRTPSTGEKDSVDVDGSELVITSEMGMRDLALSPGMHMGVDIAGPEGTPLVAFTSGKLLDKGIDGGYGNYVVWDDDKGIEHFYGHLKKPSPIEIGSSLNKGQVIGLMGNTGRSSGPHLHWETAMKTGDTGRSKSAVLSRFNPLSKYKKLDPFKLNKIPKTKQSSDGRGGNMARLSRSSNTTTSKNNQISMLNTNIGEKGSTTIIHARQPILT